MASNIHARARDFNFTLQIDDSCNCCKPKRKKCLDIDTHIFVHYDGRVEKFKIKNDNNAVVSLQASIRNVRQIIVSLAQLENQDPDEIIVAVEKISEIVLDEEKPQELTVANIARINYALHNIFGNEQFD